MSTWSSDYWNDLEEAEGEAAHRAIPRTGGGGDSMKNEPEELTREQQRSRRKREVGKVTVADRHGRTEVRHLAMLVPRLTREEEALRPRTRGDCEHSFRPCPWVSCKWNLFLDVSREGSLTLNFPDLEPDQLVESCALDIADLGGETLETVGEACNVTRERIRQLENRALFRIKRRAPLVGLDGFADQSTGERVGARNLTSPRVQHAYSGTNRCGHCGMRGHNRQTCPALFPELKEEP